MLDAADEEFDRLATAGLAAGELDRVRARILAQVFRDVDPVLGRTLALATARADPRPGRDARPSCRRGLAR